AQVTVPRHGPPRGPKLWQPPPPVDAALDSREVLGGSGRAPSEGVVEHLTPERAGPHRASAPAPAPGPRPAFPHESDLSRGHEPRNGAEHSIEQGASAPDRPGDEQHRRRP